MEPVRLTFQLPATYPYPMTYQVDFQTTDVAGVAVSDTQTFLALPSEALIGIATPYVATAGSPLAVRIAVVGANGKPIENRKVHLVLEKRTYAAATQLIEDAETPHESVEYTTVAQADTESGAQPEGGYVGWLRRPRIVSHSRELFRTQRAMRRSATLTPGLTVGPGQADWGLGQDNQLTIKTRQGVVSAQRHRHGVDRVALSRSRTGLRGHPQRRAVRLANDRARLGSSG